MLIKPHIEAGPEGLLPAATNSTADDLFSPDFYRCSSASINIRRRFGLARIYETFANRVLERFDSRSPLRALLAFLNEATAGDFYIFGGTLRRILLGSEPACDLDIMVPNGDNRAFDHLAREGLSFTLNRRRHHRYLWNEQQLDINQPQEWRKDFKSVMDALLFFDLRINSLALHFGTGAVLDLSTPST